MIVRIQGEGQYELNDAARAELDELDSKLFAAVDGGHAADFETTLAAVVNFITSNGTKVPDETLVASDVILPASDTTLDEARRLLTDEGFLKPVEA